MFQPFKQVKTIKDSIYVYILIKNYRIINNDSIQVIEKN